MLELPLRSAALHCFSSSFATLVYRGNLSALINLSLVAAARRSDWAGDFRLRISGFSLAASIDQ